MFHHFHDDRIHKRGQGSISQSDFYKLIKFMGRTNILNAKDFLLRFKENRLTSKNLCLTFDIQFTILLNLIPILAFLSIFANCIAVLESWPFWLFRLPR